MCSLVEVKLDNGKSIRVADIKQQYVNHIANCASLCNYIHKVVLFGSAIRTDCTEDSDIDIAVFGKSGDKRVLTSDSYRKFIDSLFDIDISQNYDILYFNLLRNNKSRILDDINKGVVLYDKNARCKIGIG